MKTSQVVLTLLVSGFGLSVTGCSGDLLSFADTRKASDATPSTKVAPAENTSADATGEKPATDDATTASSSGTGGAAGQCLNSEMMVAFVKAHVEKLRMDKSAAGRRKFAIVLGHLDKIKGEDPLSEIKAIAPGEIVEEKKMDKGAGAAEEGMDEEKGSKETEKAMSLALSEGREGHHGEKGEGECDGKDEKVHGYRFTQISASFRVAGCMPVDREQLTAKLQELKDKFLAHQDEAQPKVTP